MSNINPEEIISVLKSEIEDYDVKTEIQETGTVVSVGDGIANVYGINHAMYGEIVEFENGVRGLVQNIEMKTIGVVLLGSDRELTEGSKVVRTGKKACSSDNSFNVGSLPSILVIFSLACRLL